MPASCRISTSRHHQRMRGSLTHRSTSAGAGFRSNRSFANDPLRTSKHQFSLNTRRFRFQDDAPECDASRVDANIAPSLADTGDPVEVAADVARPLVRALAYTRGRGPGARAWLARHSRIRRHDLGGTRAVQNDGRHAPTRAFASG